MFSNLDRGTLQQCVFVPFCTQQTFFLQTASKLKFYKPNIFWQLYTTRDTQFNHIIKCQLQLLNFLA